MTTTVRVYKWVESFKGGQTNVDDKYAIRTVQENQKGLELTETHQLYSILTILMYRMKI
jgi:hypothetical protein